jgi:HEAT repeat protein
VVRVAAADGLRRLGKTDAALPVLVAALTDDNPWVRHEAALALDEMGPKAAPAKEALQKALDDKNDYVVRVVRHVLKVLGEK